MVWEQVYVAWRADLGPTRGAKSVLGAAWGAGRVLKQRTSGILDPSYVLASPSTPGRTTEMLQKRIANTTNAEPTHVNA